MSGQTCAPVGGILVAVAVALPYGARVGVVGVACGTAVLSWRSRQGRAPGVIGCLRGKKPARDNDKQSQQVAKGQNSIRWSPRAPPAILAAQTLA